MKRATVDLLIEVGLIVTAIGFIIMACITIDAIVDVLRNVPH